MKRTLNVKIPRLEMQGRFVPETLNTEERTVEMIFTTSAPCRMFRWKGWDIEEFNEVLSMDPAHIRGKRMESGRAPLLNSHRRFDLKDQLGVVLKAWPDGENYRGLVKFSRRKEVEEIFQDIKDGTIANGSIGYKVHKYEDISQDDDKIKTLKAVDWEPMEMSLVCVGADAEAGVRSEEMHGIKAQEFDCEIETRAESASEGEEEMKVKEETKAPVVSASVDEGGAKTEDQVKAQAIAEERARVATIESICEKAQLPVELRKELIEKGVSIDKAREIAIDEVAKRSAEHEIKNAVKVEVGEDKRDAGRAAAIESALLNRYDTGRFELTEQAREFRSMTLMEIARHCLQARGVRTSGLSKMEIATKALHTSSDFANILANVATKMLRKGYDSSPKTYEPIVREVEVPDFKEVSSLMLGGAPDLLKVPEGGEIKFGTIGESAEKYALATYARRVAITRKVIINDDVNAFTRVPELFGKAAADLEGDVVWAIITANANMADGSPLFHANHANLGTAGAPSDTTFTEMKKMMRLQKGLNGRILNIAPAHVIAPAALEHTVRKLLSTQLLATKASDINTHAGTMHPIIEPRLDAVSATAWYGAGDKNQIDMLEVAYLQGQRGLFIETKEGWDVDGLEVKARLDFAAADVEYRGLFKNAGA